MLFLCKTLLVICDSRDCPTIQLRRFSQQRKVSLPGRATRGPIPTISQMQCAAQGDPRTYPKFPASTTCSRCSKECHALRLGQNEITDFGTVLRFRSAQLGISRAECRRSLEAWRMARARQGQERTQSPHERACMPGSDRLSDDPGPASGISSEGQGHRERLIRTIFAWNVFQLDSIILRSRHNYLPRLLARVWYRGSSAQPARIVNPLSGGRNPNGSQERLAEEIRTP